jgi:hypothetical protein
VFLVLAFSAYWGGRPFLLFNLYLTKITVLSFLQNRGGRLYSCGDAQEDSGTEKKAGISSGGR